MFKMLDRSDHEEFSGSPQKGAYNVSAKPFRGIKLSGEARLSF